MLNLLLYIVNIEDALQFRGEKKSHRSRNKSQLISFWLNLRKILLLRENLAHPLMLKVHISVLSKTVSGLTSLMSTMYISRYPAMVQYSTIL